MNINREQWLLINAHKNYLKKPYKTPYTNKLEFGYLVSAATFKTIIPVNSNKKIAVLTDLILQNNNNTFTVFGYKKGELWIGELSY